MSTNWTDNSGYTQLELYTNGQYKSFVPAIDTEWLVMDRNVLLLADKIIKFYESGGIQLCYLANPALLRVFDTPVRVLEEKPLEFYENGIFRKLTLAHQKRGFLGMEKNWLYKGKLLKPETTIEFSTTGAIISST